MRGAVLTVAAVVGFTSILGAQEADHRTAPIVRRIVVHTHNIFDSTEAAHSVLFRLANAVHVTTMPGVVRRELLFHEGEPLDSAALAETLRNLRNRGLFRAVAIDTVPHGPDSVDVVVETADGWSTQLVANGRFTAGEFSWALGAVEQNLLGTGTQLGAVYRDEPDRTALQFSTGLTRLFGTRLEAAGAYDDLSDGTVGEWVVGVPFKAIADPYGVTLAGSAGRERVLQFRDGDSLDTYRRRSFVQQVTVAFAPVAGTRGYVRVGISGLVKREEYLPWSSPEAGIPDSVSGTVGPYVELLAPQFKVVTHYDGFARPSDVDVSTRLKVGAWVAPAVFGYTETSIGPEVAFQTGASWRTGFAKLEASANRLIDPAGADSGQVRVALTAASLALPRQAIVVHFEYGARSGTPPGSEFDLGHGSGPRAFGPHAFTGDRMAWGSLEHRMFLVDEVLGLLGVGVTAFVDYGGAWYRDEAARLGGDVGLGLRLGATRATGQNVGRLDVGYRFGDGFTGRRWAVSFGRGFAF